MRAEMNYFAQKPQQPVKLEEIVSVTAPLDVAKLVHEDLPLHFAHRLRLMKQVPDWRQCPELVTLQEVFDESFRDLRLVEPTDDQDISEYTKVVSAVRQRHKKVMPLLAKAVQRLYREGVMEETALNSWVDEFMVSRISTEMLTSHYVACVEDDIGQARAGESWWGPDLTVPQKATGIVDTQCDPAEICFQAAASVQRSFQTPWGPDAPVAIQVEKASSDSIGFCYISKYLFFILEELLRNSARAVVKSSTTPEQLRRNIIKVTVCADEKNVAISICDRGGGIDGKDVDNVWSYVYSTSHENDGEWQAAIEKGTISPLAGLGMGLPLSRLYVRYLGGTLEVMNMPGIGVDVYLHLNRIDVDAMKSDIDD